MKDDLLAVIKEATNPGTSVQTDATAFAGLKESELTLAEAGEALSGGAAKVLKKYPHMRYLQRLQRLSWLAQLIEDEECPVMFKLKAMEMLQKSMSDYKQEVTVQAASSVLVVHDNGRGNNDEPG